MLKKRVLKSFFLVAIILIYFRGIAVCAEENNNVFMKKNVKKICLRKAEALIGINDNFDFKFNKPPSQSISEAYIDLIYNQSAEPVYVGSYIYVYLNGYQVGTLSLIDKPLVLNKERVRLPIEYMVDGENVINIAVNRLIIDKKKNITTSGTNFVIFDRKTCISLHYSN